MRSNSHRAAAHALGYEPEEMIGRRLEEFLASPVPSLESHLQRIRERGMSSGTLRVRTRGGEERVWRFRNTLHEEAGPAAYVIAFARDVTELVAPADDQ